MALPELWCACEEEDSKLVGGASHKRCNITQPVSMTMATVFTAVPTATVSVRVVTSVRRGGVMSPMIPERQREQCMGMKIHVHSILTKSVYNRKEER